MRRRLLLLLAGCALLAGPGPAQAAAYRVDIVSGAAGDALQPAQLTVSVGDDVVVANDTSTVYDVSIGSGYQVTLLPGESADNPIGPGPYAARTPGRQALTAVRQPDGATLHGSITVVGARTSSPTPSPQPSTTRPAAGRSPAVAPPPPTRAAPSSAPPTGPRAPSRSASSRGPTAPTPAGGTPAGTPAPSRSPAPAALAGGPRQGPADRALGLAAAAAAVLVAGCATGWLRVLAAEPTAAVDERVDVARRR